MTHAWAVIRGRKEHVSPTACRGDLAPMRTRKQWVWGTIEELYKCTGCGAVLGIGKSTVQWSVNAADWKEL